jgi:hypothetical protein
MEEQLVLEKKLDVMKFQHRELDETIRKMDAERIRDEFLYAQLKRKKLKLRDEISMIEREIYDDLIA